LFEQLQKKLESLTEDPEQPTLLSEFQGKLTKLIMDLEQITESEKLLAIIALLRDALNLYPKNKQLQHLYGQGVLNALPQLFPQIPLFQVKAIINEFRTTVEQSSSAILTEYLGMILVNAIYDFGLKKHTASITDFAMELIDLARANPTNEKILTASAKGLMNAIHYFLQQNDPVAAKNFYRQLKPLVEQKLKKEVIDSRQWLLLQEHFEGS